MSETSRELILLIPDHYDIDPQALGDLREHVEFNYQADVKVTRSNNKEGIVLPLYSGDWAWPTTTRLHDDLWPRIKRVTFTLEWLAGVI